MTEIVDNVINLDTDDYCSRYRDIQLYTSSLTELDKKLWILTHFLKHGYDENRPYRLKTDPPKCLTRKKPAQPPSEELSEHNISQRHRRPKKTPTTDVTTSEPVSKPTTSSSEQPTTSHHTKTDLPSCERQHRSSRHTNFKQKKNNDSDISVRDQKNYFWEVKHS